MQYYSLQHRTLLSPPDISTTEYRVHFGPASFILSGIISPVTSSSILGTYRPEEFIFQCPIFLPFRTVHGVLNTRMLKWFAIPFSNGICLSEFSTMTCPSWVAIYGMAHSFIELHQAVVHMVRLVSSLWLWLSFISFHYL